MPTSKQRKGFKAKKIKNRQELVKSRETKEKVMQNRINAMIQQMQKEQAEKQNSPLIVPGDVFSTTISSLDPIDADVLETARIAASSIEDAVVIVDETKSNA